MSGHVRQIAGRRFSKLLVEAFIGVEQGNARWQCMCDCGSRTIARADHLRSGNTTSCGCFGKTHAVKHGHHGSRTYTSWAEMIRRCEDTNSESYADYGGRGISVCPRWRTSFEDFLADMGERPEGKTIDRIDGSLGYEPGNCRWATVAEQNRNRRSTRLSADDAAMAVELRASGLTPREIAKRFGVPPNLISQTCRRWRLANAAK